MYRQGDVLLMRVSKAACAKYKTAVARERDGALVLQHGEVTGHRHRFVEGPDLVCALRSDVASDPMVLRVLGDAVDLIHEEHATITIPRGDYAVVIQEEFEPEGWRQVID